MLNPVRLGLGSYVVCTAVRSPRCHLRDVLPLVGLREKMPRRIVGGWPMCMCMCVYVCMCACMYVCVEI